MRMMLIVVLALLIAGAVLWPTGVLDPSSTTTDSSETPLEDAGDLLEPDPEEGPRLEGTGIGAESTPEETPAPEPAPTPEPEVIPEGAVLVEGRVIDDRRRPVEGARVTMAWPPGDPGAEELVANTGSDGRYRLVVVEPSEEFQMVLIQASKGEQAAHGTTHVNAEGAAQVPNIVLKPTQSVDVQVLDSDNTPRAGAQVFVVQPAGWRMVVIQRGTCAENGQFTFKSVPIGNCLLMATAKERGKASTSLALAATAPAKVTLTLTDERTQLVRVVRKRDNAPIPGATLQIYEFLQAPNTQSYGAPTLREPPFDNLTTNEEGVVVLRGLGENETIGVTVEADGYTRRRSISQIRKGTDEYQVLLEEKRTARLPLAKDNPHAPPDGTVVTIESQANARQADLPAEGRIEGNELVIEDAPGGNFSANAVAPSGAYARVYSRGEGDEEREVVFEKPRIVTIHVKHGDGTPAAGYFVTARNQGNNVMIQPTALDDDGRVELSIRYGFLLDFYVDRIRTPYGRRAIGSLDLKEKDGGELTATLAETRTVNVRITYRGESRLPTVFFCRGADLLDEDPMQGTLQVAIPAADKEVKFTISGPEFLDQTVSVSPASTDEEATIDVRLRSGGQVLVRMKHPPDAQARIQLRATDQPQRRTPSIPYGGNQHREEDLGQEGGWHLKRFSLIAPGKRIAYDPASGAESDEFEVVEGQEVTVDLDLSRVGWAEGRIEVPSGHSLRGSRVLRLREGQARPTVQELRFGAGIRVGADGTFKVRVPGNGPIILEAYHDSLVPAEPGGRVTLTSPRQGVVLQLIEGASLSFRTDPPLDPRRPVYGDNPVQLRPAGQADATWQAYPSTTSRGVLTAKGFPAGTYDIRINLRGFAPLLLEGREVTRVTDLGTLTVSKGARIRIKLLVKEGEDPPRIFASARMDGPNGYSRFINSNGETEVLIEGLGKGTFELDARPLRAMMTSGAQSASLTKTIESDGENEIVVELDLR